ncbi:MAG: acetate kinase, partial [Eubacteriaceae bacterium]|nr:acetate kinase [Eubacteriaceae bacterium]
MKILVINCGSSSLKYQLFDMEDRSVLAKGLAERIGIEGSVLTHKPTGKDNAVFEQPMKDHKDALRILMNALVDPKCGVIKDMSEISAVGHRVVHAGEKFASSVKLTKEVVQALEDCVALAPLHNPPNLMGIEACKAILGDIPMVGVFDTAFHQTMPDYAYIYPLPYEYY